MLCTSGIVYDVIFSHYRANGAKSWMTFFMFYRVLQMAAPGRSCFYDCRLELLLTILPVVRNGNLSIVDFLEPFI